MPVVVINQSELQARTLVVQKLLRPVANVKSGPSIKRASATTSDIVLAAHDGPEPTASSYRQWRFQAFGKRLKVQYFERWMMFEDRSLYLDLAYLHFFEGRSNEEREVLLLHCDPNEPASAEHSKYKRGPHLHLAFVGDAFKHSHVALEHNYLDSILTSCETLTESFSRAIQMVREEILLNF